MKRLFIIIFVAALLVAAVILAHGQEVKASKPFEFTTEAQAIGKGTITSNYVIVKGVKLFVYVTGKNAHYYVTKAKDGEYTRRYIKL